MFMYFVCRIVEWTEIENMDVDLILSKDHQRNGRNTPDSTVSHFMKYPYGGTPTAPDPDGGWHIPYQGFSVPP